MQQSKQTEINYKDTLNLPQTGFPMRGDGPNREPEIQKLWFEGDLYKKIIDERKKNNKGRFLLHDGPPYLSSDSIHIGTALNKILKDIVVKYKTIRGYYSEYLPGFDCHGLPIENAVLKELKISRDKISPIDLRKKCAEFAAKNKISQEEKFKRLGVLGDWENAYMTMDPKFEAKQLELFGEMVEKGYIYRGLKSVYWCPLCQTALAEAEIEYVENYTSTSIYVAFPLQKLSSSANLLSDVKDLKVVIWTTTPWTIPANLGICLHAEYDYVVTETKKYGYLLLAEGLLELFLSKIDEKPKILKKIKGKDLEYSECIHPIYKRKTPIVLGEHVTLETGTGCVHTAPGHGMEDFEVGQKYKLGVLSPVDQKGCFTKEAGDELFGLKVQKEGNSKVIEILQNAGALLYYEPYQHSYPHCWRSKSPIIFRATKQWFCSIVDFRDKALKEIDNVRWIPEVGRNRIYSMVESRSDWCISRQRIWGVPIPAFYCKSCKKEHLNKKIINNLLPLVKELGSNIWWEKEANELLPKDYKCDCGKSDFVKEMDTMDVWFDSGSTHMSVVDERLDGKSPSEMYLEGSDQHRGWFQSSLITSVAVKGKAPYKEVLTHGFVLDENGRKMSKSLGNIVDPKQVISELGADILRLWVASSDYTTDLRIGKNMLKQLAEIYRNIRNTSRFILGNLYDFDPKANAIKYEDLMFIDKYALHKLEEIKANITTCMDNYQFYKFCQIIQNYCAVDLSSFYFDLIKDRLYTAGKNSKSRRAAQTVLSEILNSLLPILVPVLPHLAEDIWQHLPEKFEKYVSSSLALEWNLQKNEYLNNEIAVDFTNLFFYRDCDYVSLEEFRKNKFIGKSLEADFHIFPHNEVNYEILQKYSKELPIIFNVSHVMVYKPEDKIKNYNFQPSAIGNYGNHDVIVSKAKGEKCPRCWKYSTDIGQDKKHKTICVACANAVEGRD